MTHTLHRVGSEENLRKDYVILAMPSKDINHEGSGPKLQEIIRICLKEGAVKAGDRPVWHGVSPGRAGDYDREYRGPGGGDGGIQ